MSGQRQWSTLRTVQKVPCEQQRRKCPEDVTMRALRDIGTHTREWAETMKLIENGTESPMWTAEKEMSGICNHAAVNTHTRSGREDETRGESSRRRSHVNTCVGDADTHVTVWAGKSMQSFSKGNMSLEWWRKAEVTKCGGRGDVMCCPISSEMWLCMRYKWRKTNENLFKFYI
jgi:hypothetical protein